MDSAGSFRYSVGSDDKITAVQGGERYELGPFTSTEHAELACRVLQAAPGHPTQPSLPGLVAELRQCASTLQEWEEGLLFYDSFPDNVLVHAAAATDARAALLLLIELCPLALATKDVQGWLPLHWAAKEGHAVAVHLLLCAAPQAAKAGTPGGSTPLHLAADQIHAAAAQVLLEAAPAAAMAADVYGRLPLHVAAMKGQAAVAQLLLQAAPEAVAATDLAGELPLHHAAWGGHAGMLQLLLLAMPEAAMAVTQHGQHGQNPLHFAARRGHVSAARVLLEAAPKAAVATALYGWLPLHFVAEGGHADMVQLLVQAVPRTAMTVTTDAAGQLPLHWAARQGHADVARVLSEAAPEAATTPDAQQDIPLQLALGRLLKGPGFLETARCLVGVGPAHAALAVLCTAGDAALPLFADCIEAHSPLTDADWALVPRPCPGLGRALPAALRHSPAQAAQAVRRLLLPPAMRLRTLVLCLVQLERQAGQCLPVEVKARLLGTIDD